MTITKQRRSQVPRPRQGCWTCFLRRKKCSGDDPDCSICRRLGITCYGYGAKPVWMSGGAEEMERRNEIRQSVKMATDRLRASRALGSVRHNRQSHAANKSLKGHSWLVSHSEGATNQPKRRRISTFDVQGSAELPLWSTTPQRDYDLLTHYLNVVFPLQFPLYTPSVTDSGPFWFSLLLAQTKSLYKVVLSIAAHHQTCLQRANSRRTAPAVTDRDEEYLFEMALRGVREDVTDLSAKSCNGGLRDSLKVLACVVQLIVFEETKGGIENWQKHMTAAPGLHPFISTYCTGLMHPGCGIEQTSCLSTQQYVEAQGPLIVTSEQNTNNLISSLNFVDHAAMEFFSSVMLWFDILGTASTGQRPQYDNICAAAFGWPNSKIQLQKIMGCKNWAMVAIREIALLDDWKKKMMQERQQNFRELVERAELIKRKVQAGIEELNLSIYTDSSHIGRENLICHITNAFACGARVYLTAVLSGPDVTLPEMRAYVSATLAALRALPEPGNLRSAIWPFCIAGSMATRAQQAAFEDLASRAGIDENVLGASWRAVEVMRMCCRMREEWGSTKGHVGWVDAMERLGYRVLLV